MGVLICNSSTPVMVRGRDQILIHMLPLQRSDASKMHGSRFNCLEVTRKTATFQTGDLENKGQRQLSDWLKFDGLTSLVNLQTQAKMMFPTSANLKKLQRVAFR